MQTDDQTDAALVDSGAPAPAPADRGEEPAGRPTPLELVRKERWDPLGLHPMQLMALLVTEAELRSRNLRTWFAATIDPIKALCQEARAAGHALALVREGIRVEYLWNV
jgi:hypothetical protein